MRLSVEQPLALCRGEQGGGSLSVVHGERVSTKIELGKVAMQVGLADVVKRTVNAALQQCEAALDRIAVCVATNVFLG